MNLLLSEVVKLTVPFLAAVFAWYANEHRKRVWEEYLHKEDSYRKLLSALRGLYVTTQDTVLKQQLLDELNQCWLYCPDDIIRKAYAFIDTMKVGAGCTGQAKESACGELVAAMRRDMLKRRYVKRTKLTYRDFHHLRVT